jgi:hypothetical protein
MRDLEGKKGNGERRNVKKRKYIRKGKIRAM